jgi:hypothetical protein
MINSWKEYRSCWIFIDEYVGELIPGTPDHDLIETLRCEINVWKMKSIGFSDYQSPLKVL